MMAWFQRWAASMVVLLLVTTSCGYHTSAHGVRLPADLHTIYVPAFTNLTHTYHVEELLTAAVVRELRSRTNYRIVTTNDGSADATLSGTVLSTTIAPLTYNSQTGGIDSSLVFVGAKVSLVSSQRQGALGQSESALSRGVPDR